MKLISKVLALVIAAAALCSFGACASDEEKTNPELFGWALEYKEKTDDDGKKYAEIDGLFVSDGNALAVTDNDFEPIDLKIGLDGKITVPVYDDKGKEKYENNKLVTEEKSYDYFEISDDAFASQLIIGSVEIASTVKKIGIASFSGCANITKMTLPFVGKEIGALNTNKVFGCIFGTAEAANCTSVTMNYNSKNSTAYYIPDKLAEIAVNYPENGDGYELPMYSFNKLVGVKTITLAGNITKIGANAFDGCTGIVKFTLPKTVKVIGQSAFNGCTSLIRLDFSDTVELTTIYQNAFNGCTKLGYGTVTKYTFKLPDSVTDVYFNAFYKCTSLTIIDISGLSNVPEACFYGCSSLEKITFKNGATLENNAFRSCSKLLKANTNYDSVTANSAAFDADFFN